METLPSKNPRVLFVDDEVQVLNSLRRALHRRSVGWDVSFEPNPKAAVQTAISLPPNVVVTDFNMPELTGIEMILQMRKSLPHTTVFVLLTGAGDLQTAIEAINHAGIFRYLTKPCPVDELVQAIEDGLVSQQCETSSFQDESADPAGSALRRLSTAVVVVDRACKVLFLNESASDVLVGKNGMIIDRDGGCRALTSNGTQELRSAVREARQADQSGRYLTLSAGPEKRNLHVVVEAVSDEHVALLLANPERAPVPPVEGIQELFGLTRAEATIAYTLAGAGSLEDASVASGITVSSARTYLKRVFSKTGVSKQGELIQLLLTTPTTNPRTESTLKE